VNSEVILSIVIIVWGLWLLFLSLAFYWLIYHYKRLVRNTKGENLKVILDRILKLEVDNKKDIGQLTKEVAKLEEEGLTHVQKVGVVRFNPFEETGGDQSFSIALLNGYNTGLVVTVLHARQRTRLYVKPIKKGRSTLELSAEEKKAIGEAFKKTK